MMTTRGATNRPCPARAHFGEAAVERDLRHDGAFVACEYPERPLVPWTFLDLEHCSACRIVAAAHAAENPGATIRLSRELSAEHFGGRKAALMSEVVAYWAVAANDVAVVVFLNERLGEMLDASFEPRSWRPRPQDVVPLTL